VLLDPDGDVAAATEEFLAAGPDQDARTHVLLHLGELGALSGEPGDRVRRCRLRVAEHSSD
jgi:hypothetical protein